jgi:hypothetical protein
VPWVNPFRTRIEEVLAATEPPGGLTLPPGRDAIAVGLLMRMRLLLYASAALGDRMLAGATDPLVRAIVEAAFTAAWVLEDHDAYRRYMNQHQAKWATIARETLANNASLSESHRAELETFLEEPIASRDSDFKFEEIARRGPFAEWYTTYRMITRRAHPNLDAARSRLIWQEDDGVFAVASAPVAVELADAYMWLGVYLVARVGQLVDERLAWGRADALAMVIAPLEEEAEAARSQRDRL